MLLLLLPPLLKRELISVLFEIDWLNGEVSDPHIWGPVLTGGANFIKHGRSGDPHMKMVYLTQHE